jgi:hypothetical protein
MGSGTGRVKELQHVVAIGKQALSAGYTSTGGAVCKGATPLVEQ